MARAGWVHRLSYIQLINQLMNRSIDRSPLPRLCRAPKCRTASRPRRLGNRRHRTAQVRRELNVRKGIIGCQILNILTILFCCSNILQIPLCHYLSFMNCSWANWEHIPSGSAPMSRWRANECAGALHLVLGLGFSVRGRDKLAGLHQNIS